MSAGLRSAIRIGLLGGAVAWHLSLVGMVETFAGRDLIGAIISMGYALLLGLLLFLGNVAGRNVDQPGAAILRGAVAGAVTGAMLALLGLLIYLIALRQIFVTATTGLTQILTLEQGVGVLGLLLPVASSAAVAALGAAIGQLPQTGRRSILTAVTATILIALLRDVVYPVIGDTFFGRFFTSTGLTLIGAGFFLAAIGIISWLVRIYGLPGINTSAARQNGGAFRAGSNSRWRYLYMFITALFLFSFPHWSGPFLGTIGVLVGLYIMMGLGLNMVIGFAGMLDLGFVAFFAIGAYSMAILTSPEMGYNLSFWMVLPISMLLAMFSGILLGLPVLRMRGDYLAIATLGFGEIIRLLVLSDWLSDTLGGAQGIILIGRPSIGDFEINTAQRFFYMVVLGCLLAWFISVRLRDSRIGRSWMAIREDEDVAQAMGINRVTAKLLAFSSAAFLGGMAGAIFASLLGSVVPRSFELLISINVLSLIIVGGMGSIPGVLVGALVLVGLPELLREFREYRLMVFGAVLVIMMLHRPEGLWPEARRRAELHEAEEEPAAEEIPASAQDEQRPREGGTAPVKLEER